jgi:hypothetical protein
MTLPREALFVALTAALIASFAMSAPVRAQAPAAAPAETPPADLEPAVETSPDAARDAANGSVSEAATPAAATTQAPEAPLPPAAKATPGRAGSPQTMDRLELESTQITGNRELPKVLYIVPWKQSDLGDLIGKPANSLVDEILAPVDRDTFRRETRYYEALAPDGLRPASQSAAAPEK